jgi:hypothetical protein
MTLRQCALALRTGASAMAKTRCDPQARVYTHVTEAFCCRSLSFGARLNFDWSFVQGREHEDHRSNYVAQFVEQISRSKALTIQLVVCY